MVKHCEGKYYRFSSDLLVQVLLIIYIKKQNCHIDTIQGPKDCLLGAYAMTSTELELSCHRPYIYIDN